MYLVVSKAPDSHLSFFGAGVLPVFQERSNWMLSYMGYCFPSVLGFIKTSNPDSGQPGLQFVA